MEVETIYAKFEGENRYGKTVNEVLNTLFTTEPFLDRYDEETSEFIGYIASANTFRALFKLLPEDIYIENVFKNNVYYFETYFDSYYSGSMTAAEFFKLYDDYYKDFEAGRYEDALEKMRIGTGVVSLSLFIFVTRKRPLSLFPSFYNFFRLLIYIRCLINRCRHINLNIS